MKVRFDINDETVHYLDFFESHVFFQVYPRLPEKISFPVWGVIMDKKVFEKIDLKIPFDSDVYVAGMSVLSFYNVKGGEITVSLYDPDNPGQLLKSGEKSVKITRKWNDTNRLGDEHVYKFLCGVVLDWPYGYSEITLTAGEATIEFSLADCIPLDEYMRNAEVYSYVRFDERHYNGVLVEKYLNGNKRCEIPYKNGVPHGTYRTWYPTGQLEKVMEFKNGKGHGIRKYWYPGGLIKATAYYEWGIELEYKEWDEKGQLITIRKRDLKDPLLLKLKEIHSSIHQI